MHAVLLVAAATLSLWCGSTFPNLTAAEVEVAPPPQWECYRNLRSLRVSYLEASLEDANEDRISHLVESEQELVSRDASSRRQWTPRRGDAAVEADRWFAHAGIVTITPALRQSFDGGTGLLQIARLDPPRLPALAHRLSTIHPLLLPLAPLAWRDAQVEMDLQWHHLALHSDLQTTWKGLRPRVLAEPGPDDSQVIVLSVKTLKLVGETWERVDDGMTYQLCLRTVAGIWDQPVVVAMHAVLPGAQKPVMSWDFTYRAVTPVDGGPAIPIVETIACTRDDEALTERCTLLSVEINGQVHDSDLAIDPLLASKVLDLNTMVTVDSPRYDR